MGYVLRTPASASDKYIANTKAFEYLQRKNKPYGINGAYIPDPSMFAEMEQAFGNSEKNAPSKIDVEAAKKERLKVWDKKNDYDQRRIQGDNDHVAAKNKWMKQHSKDVYQKGRDERYITDQLRVCKHPLCKNILQGTVILCVDCEDKCYRCLAQC